MSPKEPTTGLTALVAILHATRWIAELCTLRQTRRRAIVLCVDNLVRECTRRARLFPVCHQAYQCAVLRLEDDTLLSMTHLRQPWYFQLVGRLVVWTIGTGRAVTAAFDVYTCARSC